MAENAKQHFVPQFYLRNFGRGSSISVYNMPSKRHFPRASIAGQCQRRYLHGKDPSFEKKLSKFEGEASAVIRASLKAGSLPDPGSADYRTLLHFVVLQHSRTPAARDAMATHDRKAVSLLERGGVHVTGTRWASALLDGVDGLLLGIRVAARMAGVVHDLHSKLLVNESKVEFITSDSPVVLHNQWCEDVDWTGTRGFGCGGLQIFFPLAPRAALLLYDGSVYKVGDRGIRVLKIGPGDDVHRINVLQALCAEANLYFSGDPTTEECLSRLPFSGRRTRSERTVVQHARSASGKDLIHRFEVNAAFRLRLTFMEVRRISRRVPLAVRARILRPKAQEFQAMLNAHAPPRPPGLADHEEFELIGRE